jgi:hypothetical protein
MAIISDLQERIEIEDHVWTDRAYAKQVLKAARVSRVVREAGFHRRIRHRTINKKEQGFLCLTTIPK